jgi:hypothetical protein
MVNEKVLTKLFKLAVKYKLFTLKINNNEIITLLI